MTHVYCICCGQELRNLTRNVLEQCLASLDNAKYGLTFSSGVGIITTLILMLEPGDEVVVGDDICGGSTKIFKLGLVFRASVTFQFYIFSFIRNLAPKYDITIFVRGSH
jgi:cystathionine beta-lyase/cystathionine gamma-synthase